MANNKKKSKQSASAKRAEPAKEAPTTVPSKQEQKTPFTRGQFTILMLLSIAISRLLQVRSAAAVEESSEEGEDVIIASTTCIKYLGDEVCQQEGIRQLLHWKFHTGLQATVFTVAAMLQVWFTEPVLEAFNCIFLLSPMTLGIFILGKYLKDVVWREVLVCWVLAFVALPSSPANFPFFGSAAAKRYRQKSLQSLCLVALVTMNLVQGGQLLAKALPPDDKSQFWSLPWSWETAAAALVPAPVTASAAVAPIVAFIVLDMFTMSLVHGFAWFYFAEKHQRSYLLYVAFIKLVEYLYQLPIMTDLLVDVEGKKMIALSLAVFCAFCWIAPSLSWKKKLA